ncbi:MAG: pseudouridine synthase [Chloroflexi bacterium]|nr:pseudouridine synthase [Chloroflexota bacterium]|tara:strand:+ start:1850 stop:2560 length:711 start_codon:yes stop_codon:yes gene_type:complete
MRIAKFISHSGYCSRREAEELIYSKRVMVNGYLCISPAINVSESDLIQVDYREIKLQDEIKLWKFHKPVGVITTTKDPLKRKTVFDLIPKNLPRLMPIGRLDRKSEGLLLLTNNGTLSRYFELPKNKIIRVYSVRVKGKVEENQLNVIRRGIKVDRVRYAPIKVKVESYNISSTWLKMELIEGKNREIRKICSQLGWHVHRLIRTNYGEFSLGKLQKGKIEDLTNDKFFKKIKNLI